MKNVFSYFGAGAIAFLIILLITQPGIYCRQSEPKTQTIYVPIHDTIIKVRRDTIHQDKVVYRYRVRVDSVPCLDGGRIQFNLPNGSASVEFDQDSGATLTLNTADTITIRDSVPISIPEGPQRPILSLGVLGGGSMIGPAILLKTARFSVVTGYDVKNRQINFGFFVPVSIFEPSKSIQGTTTPH